MQYGNQQGFYGQGSYTAWQASYSHNGRYVYRSSDEEGLNYDAKGKYFHLLLVRVLLGNPLKTTEVWKQKDRTDFSAVQDKLGDDYDSVVGGPHRPTLSGPYSAQQPGNDDSIIYVVYRETQCLPEFIVTYTERVG